MDPIYQEVFLSHLNPIELLPGFIKKIREIIGQVAYFTIVFDRGFFKGALFQELQSMQSFYLHGAFHIKIDVYNPESMRNKLSDRPIDDCAMDAMPSSIMSSIIIIAAILIILKFGAKNLSTNEKFIES